MKTLKLLVVGLLFIASTQAQVSVNVNLGKTPVWAPVKAVETKYYYLPDIDTYYDVPAERFIYVKKGKWVKSKRLPAHYRGYNLNKGNVIFLTDYRGNAPYAYHKRHKVKYKGNRYHPGKVIYVNGKHDNGKHKGHYKKNKNHQYYKKQNRDD